MDIAIISFPGFESIVVDLSEVSDSTMKKIREWGKSFIGCHADEYVGYSPKFQQLREDIETMLGGAVLQVKHLDITRI